jgi:hypothetical protein
VWLGSVAFYYTSDHILTHVYVCVGIRVNALENEKESVKSDNRERERERTDEGKILYYYYQQI